MEYRVCEAKTAKKLARTVNLLLTAGWEPTGGVAVAQSRSTGNWWYYQALVREQALVKPALSRVGEFAKPLSNGFGDLE